MKLKLILLIFFALTFAAQSLQAQNTYIHAGTVIDGISDEPLHEMTLVIEDGQITGMHDSFQDPGSGDELVDLSDHTVMPGFIDMHVHLEGETTPERYVETFTLDPEDVAFRSTTYAERTLKAGFTTVRDLGGSGVNISLRDAIEQGHVDGPRVLTAGYGLAVTGGHGDPTNAHNRELRDNPGPHEGVVDGISEAKKGVRHQIKIGADWIKITATGGVLSVAREGERPQFTESEIEAIVETAADWGVDVAAHAHGDEGMQRAVRAGVKTIDHGTRMSEETMELMKDHGTHYVPTITAGRHVAEMAEEEGYYPDVVRPKAQELGPLIQDTFGEAWRAEVPIAFGTDAGVFPHGENAREFVYMVETGYPEMDAIRSATSTNADVLGLENVGTLREGYIADIIAVEGNPLEDIELLKEMDFVMKDGKIYLNQ